MHNDDIVRQPIDPDAAVILDNPEMVLPTVTEQTFPVLRETMSAPAGRDLAKEQADALGLRWGGPHHRRPPWAD